MKGANSVIAMLVMLAVVQQMVIPGEAITCGQVDGFLAPCVSYLVSGGAPSAACCAGVKSIKDAAITLADKQVACQCIKDAANHYADLKDDAAAALPTKCNVPLNIPVSRNTNCQDLHYMEDTDNKL